MLNQSLWNKQHEIQHIFIGLIAGGWSLASDIPDHGIQEQQLDHRTLIDTSSNANDTCSKICDSSDEPFSAQVQVTEEDVDNVSFFGRLINRLNGSFDNGSRFGRFMNGLFNFFHRQSSKPRYEISTDLLMSTLSNYSVKAKSLAALIRRDSESYAAESDTPEIVTTIFTLSADNMESVASVIDPIVDDMRQYKTMDLATVSCSIGQLLKHLCDETFPNFVSIAEFVYTKSDNDDMEKMYDNYVTSKTTTPFHVVEESQCVALDRSGSSAPTAVQKANTTIQAQITENGSYLGMLGQTLLPIVGLIIIFPLAIIVSIATFVFAIFTLTFSLIFKRPLFPEADISSDQNGDPHDDCSNILCAPEFQVFLAISLVIVLILLPILVPIGIVFLIIQFVLELLSPILSLTKASKETNDVMDHVMLLLESPMDIVVHSLTLIYYSDAPDEAEWELDCDLKTMLCQHDALMASKPF